MLKEFLGLSGTGIYMTTFYFGVLIGIPARPLLKISSTLIAEAWKNDDRKTINEVYEKSSLNQFIIGMLLFLGIWLNEENIFRVLPAEYAAGRYVILFIGITYLFEMLSGASTAIISTSKYYKYQAYFMFVLIVLVVASNFIFIPLWGIVGAAVASLCSKLIVFTLRYAFIYKKFKFQPYTPKFLIVLLIGVITYVCGYFTPTLDNLILSLIIKSAVIATVFLVLLIIFKPSEDIQRIIKNTLAMVRKGR
jgi:O-antigen/teichoic acid export membrane protein